VLGEAGIRVELKLQAPADTSIARVSQPVSILARRVGIVFNT
jgi:hypothetical protein